ncbi:hypothetical protein ABZV15_41365 [Streptomyces sp. NPDC005246]|uniref:hypothetical protein n=1 Tax=Streptomyces sp. NPDC005246 TaxID=3156716 RepID=UPI0033ACD754
MTYSANRTDTNVVVLALVWGVFIYTGMIAMYYLGRAFWLNESDQATTSDGAASGVAASCLNDSRVGPKQSVPPPGPEPPGTPGPRPS